jgi:hypothetical protein
MYSTNYAAVRHRELLAQARRDGQVAHLRALRRAARRVDRAARRLERAQHAARQLRGAGQLS